MNYLQRTVYLCCAGVCGCRRVHDERQSAETQKEQKEVEEAVVPAQRQGALHL